MAKKNEIQQSDKKKFKEYFRKAKSQNVVSMIGISMREYGIFIVPLIAAYLLFYYIVFENGGAEEGIRGLYVLLLFIILVVDAAAYFLRMMYRNHKFRNYSEQRVPLFKGNTWRCPHCANDNKLNSPCVKCGIYPVLYKSENETPVTSKRKLSKKEQKQYDEYVPQFK